MKGDPPTIDAVYTWVDGKDPTWLAKRIAAQPSGFEGEHGPRSVAWQSNPCARGRFECRDELKYSLRSVEQFAPFLRRVHLVTDRQVPDWLNVDHPDLHLVIHEDIFPDARDLPTFNSRAIESHLHRIPGLSERFVYFNDDVLLAGPVTNADFFDAENRISVYLDRRRLSWNPQTPQYSQPEAVAARTGSRLLERDFGYRIQHQIDHVPHALTISIANGAWSKYAHELSRTSSRAFRHPEDLKPTSSFYQFYALCTGRANLIAHSPTTYIKVKKRRKMKVSMAAKLLWHVLAARSKFICLNDSDVPDDSWLTLTAMDRFLARTYPNKSRFEL